MTHNIHLHQEDQKTEAAVEYPERRDLLKSVSVYDLETVSKVSVERVRYIRTCTSHKASQLVDN